MENKKKKTIILISIIVVLIIAIVACVLIFTKSNNNQEKPNSKPNQSEENNKPNDNNQDKPNDDNSDNNTNNDNNNDNQNSSNPGNNNSGNDNQGGTTTSEPKKLRIYSCRRSVEENGIEIADSLTLTYHIENGLQSDEVIVTVRAVNSTGTNNINSTIEFYKNWFNQLNAQKGITVTTTQSGDKTVFRIKTDYTKVDYSNINFEDENRLQFYNDIRANDSLEVITEFLKEAGYTCQQPKEA